MRESNVRVPLCTERDGSHDLVPSEALSWSTTFLAIFSCPWLRLENVIGSSYFVFPITTHTLCFGSPVLLPLTISWHH